MYLVFKLSHDLGETERAIEVVVKLEDEDAQALGEFKVSINIQRDAQGVKPEPQFIVALNDLVLLRPGSYEFVIYIDDERIGAAPIKAVQLPAGE